MICSSPPLPMGDTFLESQWMPEAINSTEPYIHYGFPIHKHRPFHLKEAFNGFSLEYLNCQHHNFYTLEP